MGGAARIGAASLRVPATLIARAEAMALRGREERWSFIPAALARRLRPRVVHVGDGLACVLGASDSLNTNRVIGLGHRGRAREAMLDEIIELYRSAGVRRFSLQPSPGRQAAAIGDWARRRGMQRRTGYLMLVRDLRRPIPPAGDGPRVAPARRRDFDSVARIYDTVFARPASHLAWSQALIAGSAAEHFLAFTGATPIAAGTLRVERHLAWLGGGATLTRWRGRGAHAALIVARLRRARALGARWAWVETSEPERGRPDGSRRNLVRLGFAPLCIKPSYVWVRR